MSDIAAAESVDFVVSAIAPEVDFAWDRLAVENADRSALAVDIREIRNLGSGFVAIRVTLACPGAAPIWTAALAPYPADRPGRFLLAVPDDARPTCAARLSLRLDASAASSSAPDRTLAIHGALSRQATSAK